MLVDTGATTSSDSAPIVDTGATPPEEETQTPAEEAPPAEQTPVVDEPATVDEAVAIDTGATVQTDKPDYAQIETPSISGMGFPSNSLLTITITAPDGTITTLNTNTNEQGQFNTTYLGPLGEGTYTVITTDGINTATTTFTDKPISYAIEGWKNNMSPPPRRMGGEWESQW